MHMANPLKFIILTLFILVAIIATANGEVLPHYQSEDTLDDVMENVKDAIIGRGLNISHTLHASEMLNNTGADLGYPDNVFIDAQTIGFCSAELSHQLVVANPNNIVLCPFTISIYQLSSKPEVTHVSYRMPSAGEETKEIVIKVEQLIKEIIAEALE